MTIDSTQSILRNKGLIFAKPLLPWILILVSVGAVLIVLADRGVYIAAVCALALVSSGVVAFGWLAQEDLFNPLGGVWVSLFLGTGIRAVYLATSASDRVQTMMWHLDFDDLAVSATIAAVAAVAIICGYLFGGRLALRMRPRTVVDMSHGRLLSISLIVFVLAIFVAIDFFRQTGFDLSIALSSKRRLAIDGQNVQSFATLGYHRWMAYTLPSVIFYFWFWEFVRTRSRFAGICAFVFFLLASGFAFLSSSRSLICVLLLNSLYILNAFRYLRSSHIVLVLICVIALLSVMLGLRRMSSGNSSQMGIADMLAPTAAVDAILGNENFSDIGRLSLIYQSVPGVMNYKYGKSYITWIFAPIPRTHWREKPVLSQGLEVSEVIYGSERSAKGIAGGGRPPCFIGEVIMNFGVFLVPVCAALYGVGLRMFQNFQSSNARSNVLLSIFVLIPASFGLMGGEFSHTVIEVAQGLLPTMCVLLICAKIVDGVQLDAMA